MAAGNLNPAYRHGHCFRSKPTTTYRAWTAMIDRCLRVKCKNYVQYGGRGIKICDRWLDFANFLADMGERPNGMTLDRIDNNGHYEPANCRWADKITQIRNRSNTVMLDSNGKRMSLAEWAEFAGISYKCFARRLKLGWTIDKILSTPKMSIKECSALGLRKRWG